MDDVLLFRTPDVHAKNALLADDTQPFFTTPHFEGWPGVLLRMRNLPDTDEDILQEVVTEAWLTKAPKRLAKQWADGARESDHRHG